MDWPICKLQVSEWFSFDLICPSRIAKINKLPKFDNNFDIRCQLEHFDYNRTKVKPPEKYKYKSKKWYLQFLVWMVVEFLWTLFFPNQFYGRTDFLVYQLPQLTHIPVFCLDFSLKDLCTFLWPLVIKLLDRRHFDL